jgi:ribose transport system substrate-binding protein
MKIRSASVVIFSCFAIAACSSGMTDGGMGGSDGSTDGEAKEINREEVPDGRFKPQELEDTIDAMVAGIEANASADDEVSLGVVLKELTNFWRPVAVGANRAIGELEVIGSVKGTTEEDLTVEESVAEQISFVEEQLDLDVDGLAIAPHNEDLLPYMNEFTDANKPIVTIDSDMTSSGRDIFIGTDNLQGGVTGGETMVEVLDGVSGGRVIVLGNTDPGWVGGYDRTNAAASVIEGAGFTVEILNSIWVPEDEVAQIADAIADDSSGEPLVGMIGVFANAHALATAAVDAELEEMPKIVAFDFEPDTLTYMEQGVISATHVQRQYYMGYMSVYVLYSIKTVGLAETKATLGSRLIDDFHLDTGLDVIRAEDLDEYNTFIDDLGI